MPSEIEKVIGETGGVVIDKVITRENQMVGRALPQQLEGEELGAELLDSTVTDSLNRTYIENTVIAAILQKRETYASSVKKGNAYQTQLEELSRHLSY